jgi:hypothetical protein
VILRCTRKLLSVMKANVSMGLEPQPNGEDWYANLLWFDHRKCLLLTHAGTLLYPSSTPTCASRDSAALAVSGGQADRPVLALHSTRAQPGRPC